MDKSLILNEIRKYLNIKTDTEFANFLGIKQNTLSSWKARNSIDYDLIISKCDYLNANWLLTGEGSMLKEEEVKKVAPQDLPTANDEVSTLLREKAAMLEAIIKEKEEKEAMYKEKIMALENELQEYKNLKKGYQQEEEEEDEMIEILPMAAEPAPIPAELLKAKQGEYRRI